MNRGVGTIELFSAESYVLSSFLLVLGGRGERRRYW